MAQLLLSQISQKKPPISEPPHLQERKDVDKKRAAEKVVLLFSKNQPQNK